jgi:hypothetical protein
MFKRFMKNKNVIAVIAIGAMYIGVMQIINPQDVSLTSIRIDGVLWITMGFMSIRNSIVKFARKGNK